MLEKYKVGLLEQHALSRTQERDLMSAKSG